MTKVFSLLIWLSILLACRLTIPLNFQEPDIPKEVLEVPNKGFSSVLRFPDGNILLAVDDKYVISRFYHLKDQHLLEIPTEPDPRCRKTDYLFPTALPDGRLGYLMLCHGRWSDRPIGQDGAAYILAYDWNSGDFEHIIANPLPYGASDFSWNPEMTRGVQATIGLLGTIYWLTSQGMEPITLTLRSEDQSWSLDENFEAMEDLDRIDVGIARSPAWSPDGQWIAFLASLDAMGRDGFDRARASYNLYLLDPDELEVKSILEGITDTGGAGSLSWSPNSQWLLLDGRIGVRDGLWLVSRSGETVQFVDGSSPGSLDGMAWIDDRTVIATRCISKTITPCLLSEVSQYDVSAVVQASP